MRPKSLQNIEKRHQNRPKTCKIFLFIGTVLLFPIWCLLKLKKRNVSIKQNLKKKAVDN